MMKIVFTTKVYLPHIGGVELYIRDICRECNNKKNVLSVITADTDIKDVAIQFIENVKVIRIPCKSIAGLFFLRNTEDYEVINEEIKDADVVHVNDCKFIYDYVAKRKEKYKYRLLISSHGWLFHTRKYMLIKKLYFYFVVKKYSYKYDEIFCVSNQDQKIAHRYGIKDTKVILSGADINKYKDIKGKHEFNNRFFYWGRVANNKGLYECLNKLMEIEKDYIFWIAGKCEDEKYMKKLTNFIKENRIEDKVVFLGSVTDEDIKKRIEMTDVILFPSLHEGFGITLVEGIMTGKPIIAQKNESYEYILKTVGAEVFLFDFQSKEKSIKKKINEVIYANVKLRNIDQFSVERMIKETISYY